MQIDLFNINIEQCSSSSLLGITLDTKFNWKDHIAKLLSKLLPLKPLFYQIRDNLNKQSKYLLYHSLVQSRLSYGIEFYECASKTDLHPIVISQNRIIKILFSLPFKHSSSALYKLLHIQLYKFKLFAIDHKGIVHSKIIHFPSNLLHLFLSPRINLTIRLNHTLLSSKDILLNIFQNWNSVIIDVWSIVSLTHAVQSLQNTENPVMT